uniref:Protein kinase domain-containing protein n=1 Tax=Meloidogyne javanica TaxID=6303 RepID=A0A915MNU0_MELJA
MTVAANINYNLIYPKFCISILIKNEHVLPYFMGLIEDWRYPKDRIHLNFFAENDDSGIIRWIQDFPKGLYLSMSLTEVDQNWREFSLNFGRRKSCNFLLILDTNNFLLRDSLRQLISFAELPVVLSPFLDSPMKGSVYYSNGPLLINLKHPDSSYLTFEENNLLGYEGSGDPIDVFASSAYKMNIPILFSNHFYYGYFLYPSRLNGEHASLFGFDQIYLINLARRPERLNKMAQILRLVGMKFERFEAVDGQNLTKRQLDSLNFLPGYLDPHQRRPMKLGEIGCFLSHYKVWKDVVANGFDRAIVLNKMVQDLMKTREDWDFIYFGRKINKGGNPEFFVLGHSHLSTISYSYWTIGYAISLSGAKKLIEADPLNNLLTLDEFLPIMYSQHPNQIWSRFFEDKEKLNAFAVYPLILEPERYSSHSDFLSDTEGSEQVDFNYLSSRGEENNGGEKKFLENEFRDVDVEIDGKLLRLKRVIATGGFSQIYLAEEASNNEKFAIKKILCHGQDEIKCVRREIEISEAIEYLHSAKPAIAHR